jgi:hypothetical protein
MVTNTKECQETNTTTASHDIHVFDKPDGMLNEEGYVFEASVDYAAALLSG